MFSKLILRLGQVKPVNLLIYFDGPKDNDIDREKVIKTRAVLKSINWDCNLRISAQSENLGCGVAMNSAISWGFELFEALIILEDDILPSVSFFDFMSLSLEKFKNETQILGIGGFNRGIYNLDHAEARNMVLSKYPSIWGWGTWKDRWLTYDLNILDKRLNYFSILRQNNYNLIMVFYFLYNFKKISHKKLDTWDYQLTYLAFISKKFFVLPGSNLVENIGIGLDSTHTSKPIIYPRAIELDNIATETPKYKKKLDKSYRKNRRKDLQKFFTIFFIDRLKYFFSSIK